MTARVAVTNDCGQFPWAGAAATLGSVASKGSLMAEPSASSAGRLVRTGAVIAAVFWAISGVAALFSPTGDASELGSASFYIIEGTHALAETGMLVALLGLWRHRAWSRPTRAGLWVAIASTALLALITYLTVVLMWAGASPEDSGDVASLFFVLSLLGTLLGFVWLGIALVRSGHVPPAIGWLLAAHPSVLAVLLFFYPMGLGLGVLWAGIAWVSRTLDPARTAA